MLILTRSDVELAISMQQAVSRVKRAFAALSTGQALVPLRMILSTPKHQGTTLVMPAYLPEEEALAVKIASVHKQNPGRQLPLVHALIALIDPTTGQTLAIMDGTYLTALRTGAASGVATDLLARHDAGTAAVFGAGVQGQMQLAGVCSVRPITRVWLYDPNPDKVTALMRHVHEEIDSAVEVIAADSPSQAVREADIVCTATTSATPVFDGNELRAGTHINAIGSYHPGMQEVDSITLQRAKIVVDSRAGALAEAGDLIIPYQEGEITIDSIHAELGEILAGLRPGRENDAEITYFKSVGNAVQDVSVAQEVYNHALRIGLGTWVEL